MGSRELSLDHAVSFTQLQATLEEFLKSRDGSEMIGDLSEGIETRREELVLPDPSRCYPKSEQDRTTLKTGTMPMRGFQAKLPEQAIAELVKLSDELNINERLCVDLWSQVNAPWQRRALEKRLSDPAGSLSNDLPLAARKLFYLERHNLLLFESELLKAGLVNDMSTAKKALIEREIFSLLESGLAPSLMSFVAELLGPEGLRRAPTSVSTPTHGAFGAAPAPAAAAGTAAASGGLSEGAVARREEFMLHSLMRAVETLFFIYYSYQIKPAEAKQLVNLLETAGRELLRLEKTVGESSAGQGASRLHGGLRSGGPFGGPFGGGAANRGVGNRGGVGGGGLGAAGAQTAESQRDVARLCAVMEVTAVLLCTVSMALSQDYSLHGRDSAGQINSKGNELAIFAAGSGAGGRRASGGGGGGGGGGLKGSTQDITDLDQLICGRLWDHVQVQGAAQAIWGAFVAPFAAAQQAFAGAGNADQHLHQIMGAVAAKGAVKFLREEVLTTLRRPPFPGLDLMPRAFYLEALSGLALSYVTIGLSSPDCRLMPRTMEQLLEDLQTPWFNPNMRVNGVTVTGDGFGQQQGQGEQAALAAEIAAMKEDTLEDVMCWTGQLAEAHPDLATKLWEGPMSLPVYLQDVASNNRDILATWLVFMGGMALETPEETFRLMDVDSSAIGWEFFIRNLEMIPASLNPAPPANQPIDGVGYVAPAPRVKLSDRTYEVFEALCGLLQRIMQDDSIRQQLARGENFRVLTALTNLVRCGVRPSLKGAIFKALAACARDPEIVPHIWNFIEDSQLVPTGSAGYIQDQAGGRAPTNHGGLFFELEQVEAKDGTYPATEGFCCLIQELVQHDLPYGLGESRRYSGLGGIQPYVSYLQDYVLMPDLRFTDPGERWRIVARVLQVIVTLLRRYPLTRAGGGAAGKHLGSAYLATPDDEESCRLDFATGSSAQRRSKSPGYYILRQMLGQGGLFRQLVQILREGGGVSGLAVNRTENATATVLKQILMKTSSQMGGGSSLATDRLGNSPGNGSASQTASSSGSASEGGPGPDWSWWRERSVMLALSLVDAAAEREDAFIVQWRERVAAGGVDDDVDTPAAGFGAGGTLKIGGGGIGVAGGAGGRRAGGGSLGPPANLGKLLAEGNTVATVARYIEYDGNMVIPLLSASLLLSCSRNLPPGTLLGTLLASDPRECDALAEAYTSCLAADGLGPGARLPSLEAMLCAPGGEADSDFMTLDAALVGAGGSSYRGDSERDFESEEGALRTVRLCILDLLLENVQQRGPNLAHLLLGLDAGNARGGRSSGRGRAGGDPSPSACLEAIVGLLRNPSTVKQEPRLAEKCAHLVYKLCSSEDTRVPVLDRLRHAAGSQSNEAFFPNALRVALAEKSHLLPADPKGNASFGNHCVAWLLKGAAIDIRTSCEGNALHLSHARALLRAMFVGDASNAAAAVAAGTRSGGGAFGMLSGSSTASTTLDQARAPLLTLLETKIELGLEGPVRNPGDNIVRGLLVQAAIPLPPPGGCPEAGGQEFRIIDAAHLQEMLRADAASRGLGEGALSGEAQKRVSVTLTWAAQWNQHTVNLASQAHLCQAWRQVLEVAFVSAGGLLFGSFQDPSKAVAPRRLLSALLLGVLRKLLGKGGAEERLLQPLGRACLAVVGVMRQLGSSAPLQLAEAKQLISRLMQCLAGTKGIVAASNANTPGDGSKVYRASLYGCLIHLLEHTQGRGDAGSAQDGVSIAWSGQGETDGLLAGASSLSSPSPSSHEALRGEHRLQNVELLREQIEPLAYLLNEDARHGPSMSQCLGLTLLSSIVATLTLNLGLGPGVGVLQGVLSSAGSRNRRGIFSEDTHVKELQGTQTRVALLQFLHSKGFFVDLAKLLKGLRPGSGVAVPQLVLESIIGLLTQVACSTEGAVCLLEAGVVSGLAESERIKAASDIAVRASKLGALGVDSDKGGAEFQAEGPASLRVLVIPGLMLLQSMLSSLPSNVILADQTADFLARHAQLVRHILLFKENSLDTLKAMSAALGIVAHVFKPPFQELLDSKVGAEVARGWRDLAERALIAFGGNPLPQGSGDGVGWWWSNVQPMTAMEEAMANERCQGPPGGPVSEWTAFDSAKLEASQRALAHAVDVLRFRAAAATSQTKVNGNGVNDGSKNLAWRSWLANSPEGLCVALRACVDNARVGSRQGGRGAGGMIAGGVGAGFRIGAQASGGADGDGSVVRSLLLPYVVEGLLAALLLLVDAKSDDGKRQLSAYRKGLVPTLTELLQDVSNEAFVLRSARTLMGRVSAREENGINKISSAFGGVDDSMMTVA